MGNGSILVAALNQENDTACDPEYRPLRRNTLHKGGYIMDNRVALDTKIEDLSKIIREGEGYNIEFKRSPDKSLAIETCAFSNASGGRIFIGVDDHGRIVGTDTGNNARSRIQDTINNVVPRPDTSLDICGKVIIVTVQEGTKKPYACSDGFYIRIGPNSQKLSTEEIFDFLQSEGIIRYDTIVRNNYPVDENFSVAAYEKFIRKAEIDSALPREHVLQSLNCAGRNNKNELVYTNAGALFFRDNNKDNHFSYAKVACVLFKGLDKYKVLDAKFFNGGMLDNIDDAMAFLKKHLNLRYEFGGGVQRKEILELPEDALREAVINAVCHRNYFEEGANVQIEIFDDRVEITNPGGLPKGMTLDKLGEKSVARNLIIAELLCRADYIEKLGTGVKKMREDMAEIGLDPPIFESTYFFTAIFKRPLPYVREALDDVAIDPSNLSEKESEIYALICVGEVNTTVKISERTGIPERTVRRTVSKLVEEGYIKRAGGKKTGKLVPAQKMKK